MILNLFLELTIVVGISVIAHVLVAYGLAPRKAKQGILNALVYDDGFKSSLMDTLFGELGRKRMFKDAKTGDQHESTYIEELKNLIGSDIMNRFSMSIKGSQSQMAQELEKNAQSAIAAMPDNPMLGLALSQIPKKYLPYIQLIASMMQPRE